MKDMLPVIISVLTDKRVIITAVVVLVYLNFCCFIVHYRKKIKMPKKKILSVTPASNGEHETDADEKKSDGDAES